MAKWRKKRDMVHHPILLLRLLFLWATELTTKNTTSLLLFLLFLDRFLRKDQATRAVFWKIIFPLFSRWTMTTVSPSYLEIEHVLVSILGKASLSPFTSRVDITNFVLKYFCFMVSCSFQWILQRCCGCFC